MSKVKIRKYVIQTIEVDPEIAANHIVEAKIFREELKTVLDLYVAEPKTHHKGNMLQRVASIPAPPSSEVDWTDSDALLKYARENFPKHIDFLDLT